MEASELRSWLISSEGMAAEIAALRRWAASKSFGPNVVAPSEDYASYTPDWRRLLLAASLLAGSRQDEHCDVALVIAQAATMHGQSALISDAGAVILTQLSNRRAVSLAEKRHHIEPSLDERLGLGESLLATRRLLESSIVLNAQTVIDANAFQRDLWAKLSFADWTSASAPTAVGKTFLIANWLLKEVEASRCRLGVFLAPTRALVSEIEKGLLDLKGGFDVPNLRIASMPIAQLGDGEAPTLLVFTQERLHLFFNQCEAPPTIDITVVDEVQKLGDGSRGVILQEAIERIARANYQGRFVFLSPHADNPETLLDEAPINATTAAIPGGASTVTQNLMVARQKHRKPTEWTLTLVGDSKSQPFGEFQLHERPASATETKRLSFVALALGRAEAGTLVYANGQAEAEKLAVQIFEGLKVIEGASATPLDEDLKNLSDFCRTSIHEKFQLVRLVKRGVAFHYGNMPSILRAEIERLFREGKIRFLVCTSTLVEGVNLACRTIVIRGPKKGIGVPMSPQDFWNLAGRAGRWGDDFQGNIVCVDPDREKLWPFGIPQKTTYPILRETDEVIRDTEQIIRYIDKQADDVLRSVDMKIEPVTAYLLSWYGREGSVTESPPCKRLKRDVVAELNRVAARALDAVEIPHDVVAAHPGISAVALQRLLENFKSYPGELNWLLPPMPGDENAAGALKEVFGRVNDSLYEAFGSERLQWAAAFTTVDWMRGRKLSMMIDGAIDREKSKNGDVVNYAKIIRDTMRFVEEYARFKAPKYLSAYLDVLQVHYTQKGCIEEFPEDLPIDLYLEFGVNTKTLLSFITLGLSRTSSVSLYEYLADSEMSEDEVFAFLQEGEWETYDLPQLVKREVIPTCIDQHPCAH